MNNKVILILSSVLLFSCGTSNVSFSTGVSNIDSSEGGTSLSSLPFESESEKTSFSKPSSEESFPLFDSSSTQESLEDSSSEEISLSISNESTESGSQEDFSESEMTSSEEPSQTSEALTSEEPIEEPLDPMGEPYIGKQFYLNHIGDIYSSWNSYRGKGVTIAVIDAGFNPYHEDFYDKNGVSKISSLSACFEEKNGQTTTSVGIDKCVNMGESHGTFCAGIAGAAINGKGVVGIAPESTLLLLKTDQRPRSIEKAFRYAADNGAKVITISIGSYYDYRGDLIDDGSDLGTVFDPAISYCRNKGVVIVSAAGNGGLDNMPTEFTFPGCCDNVIGVGGLAFDSSTDIWSGSSYNSSPEYEFCDVFAPSEEMFGCCHYGDKFYDGGWKGTSFASPIVAGIAALYFEKNPSKTPADFEKDLYSTCDRLISETTPKTNQLGRGRVDAGALLGTNPTGSVQSKIKAYWSNAFCYAWNSVSGNDIGQWPGKKMEKVGDNEYAFNIDLAQYDSLIFTDGTSQTVCVAASSFASGSTYSILDGGNVNGRCVGRYFQQ